MTVAPRHPPLAVDNLEDAARVVRDAGGRLTAPRRAVLEALLTAEDPVSAEQIADGLGGRLPTTEAVSVYRNLDWLEEIGVVRHVHIGHGPGLYALTLPHEHEYLVCERCHRLTAVESTWLDPIRDEIRARFGYEARFGHFPIVGLCPDCARGTSPRSADV
jgi:Fur family transcriptional regulator, ferric uptake regulator